MLRRGATFCGKPIVEGSEYCKEQEAVRRTCEKYKDILKV